MELADQVSCLNQTRMAQAEATRINRVRDLQLLANSNSNFNGCKDVKQELELLAGLKEPCIPYPPDLGKRKTFQTGFCAQTPKRFLEQTRGRSDTTPKTEHKFCPTYSTAHFVHC